MLTHAAHAKRARVATPCTAHHVNYGGGCLNCGYRLTPHNARTDAERRTSLRVLGYIIPEPIYPHPSRVTVTSRFHVTGLQPDTQEPRP